MFIRFPVILALLCLLVAAGRVWGDVVYLKNGGLVDGKIVLETEEVIKVELDEGTVTIPRAVVERVVKGKEGFSPTDEYMRRKEALKEGGTAQEHMKLGKFCFENELYGYARVEFKRALELEPSLWEEVKKWLGRIQAAEDYETGKLLAEHGEYQQAASYLKDAVKGGAGKAAEELLAQVQEKMREVSKEAQGEPIAEIKPVQSQPYMQWLFFPEIPNLRKLKGLIESAQRKIVAVCEDIDITGVTEALYSAAKRGVEVEIIVGQKRVNPFLRHLETAGGRVSAWQEKGLFTNNFWVFDNEIVWVGSFKPIEFSAWFDKAWALVLHDREAALVFSKVVEDLLDGRFEEQRHVLAGIGAKRVEIYFLPYQGVEEKIAKEIEKSNRVVFVLDKPDERGILEALMEKGKKGAGVIGGGNRRVVGRLVTCGLRVNSLPDKGRGWENILVCDDTLILSSAPLNDDGLGGWGVVLFVRDVDATEKFLSHITDLM